MLKHAFIMSVHTNMEQLQVLVTALHFEMFIFMLIKNKKLYTKI